MPKKKAEKMELYLNKNHFDTYLELLNTALVKTKLDLVGLNSSFGKLKRRLI